MKQIQNSKLKSLLILWLIGLTFNSISQSLSYDIRLNQLGFLPNTVKLAAVVNTQADSFKVMTSDLQAMVYEGQFLPPAYYSSSGEDVFIADFTLLTDSGDYVIVVEDLGKSVPFTVGENIFTGLAKASLKQYYFNRASSPVLSQFGGRWARDAGHPDTSVVVLPSAASPNRPAGTIISTPGGWYDAGDYNKYIVSCGTAVFTLLSAYETYPEFYDTLNLNIPESSNDIPDILDEALYNIKWMMTMQDEDGGVYNKTTHANFSGFVMPSEVNATRYVCAKGTAATLDFAAMMAMTARIFRKYDVPLADSALVQAERAWQWAKANPNVIFTNPSSSGGYPGVNTGEYHDSGFEDEFTWGASEIYITTRDPKYYDEINFEQSFGIPGWPTVQTLGLISLLVNQDSLTEIADVEMIKNTFVNAVSGTKNNVPSSPYRLPGDFYYWSGNNAFANWGMLFLQAFRVTGDASYFNAAVASLDYLMGKNATTYCFVTGFGSKSPMHPHHRISSSDGVSEPVPGMLVGGANNGDGGDCGASSYPSTFAAKSYLDNVCSYSTNEIAIGINSGLVFLSGAIMAEYSLNFTDTMPQFFLISTNKISLTYNVVTGVPLVIEGNTTWELKPSENWILISALTGSGNATLQVNSSSNNPKDEERSAKIYVYSQNVLTDSILVTQNGKRRSFKIEAEDYMDKFGTQNETTADEGGGENVGYVGEDNWLEYSLDVSYDGIYDFIFRHAGYAGDIDVYIDDVFVQNIKFPATADWQVWENYTTEIELTEGQHILKLEFNSVGTNLNWYQFDWERLSTIHDQLNDGVSIFPNPASKVLYVEFKTKHNTGEVVIYSIDGKQLVHHPCLGNSIELIDVSTLEKGTYILKAKFEANTITSILIID